MLLLVGQAIKNSFKHLITGFKCVVCVCVCWCPKFKESIHCSLSRCLLRVDSNHLWPCVSCYPPGSSSSARKVTFLQRKPTFGAMKKNTWTASVRLKVNSRRPQARKTITPPQSVPMGNNKRSATLTLTPTVCFSVLIKRSRSRARPPWFASGSYITGRRVLPCLEQFWNIHEGMTGKGKYGHFQSRR